MPKRFLAVLLLSYLLTLTPWTTAQGQHSLPILPDSARPAGPLAGIRSKGWRVAAAVAPPMALIGYGLLTRGHERVAGMLDSRFDTQQELQEHYGGFRTTVDNYSRHLPAVAAFGLSLAGLPAQHDLVERALLYEAASLVSGGITSYLKHAVADARPYDSTLLTSFPSYHTTQAFTGATFLAEEYGGRSGWYAVAGYTVATATGALRLLNNAHWSSDVLVGAGIGILSTELVYAVYPLIKEHLLGGRSPAALLLPTRPAGSKLGVGLVWVLR